MKAVGVFPAERRFEVIDHPEPRIERPDQVKLRMLEVGICGTDKEIVSFAYGTPPEESPYLILGHESLAEVTETGREAIGLAPGDLVVSTVRRPCGIASCMACNHGRQDFCETGQFTERGIQKRHGFMSEHVVESAGRLHRVPAGLREVAVLVEPLTIAEKAMQQYWQVQQRLPWSSEQVPPEPDQPRGLGKNAVVLGAGPVGLLGAMKLVLEGFDTTVYSLSPPGTDLAALSASFGARFVAAETNSLDDLARGIENIDVVYEATGVSALSYAMLQHLGTNGAFLFTGVPALRGPKAVDIDAIMRAQVLKNQVVLGTVNAGPQSFTGAISDLGQFYSRWSEAVSALITQRVPIDNAAEPLSGKSGGIKTVIRIA